VKQVVVKRSKKELRKDKVLFGLIEHYLKSGKPVGSHTLQEEGFDDLSSATIRNYFAQLEEEGYLKQQHASGGRIPTEKAIRLYVKEHLDAGIINPEEEEQLALLRREETKEIAKFLQKAAEQLSGLSSLAVFLSAPRFDNDFITDVKIVSIDPSRVLCVLITDFGVIQTETLFTDKKLTAFSAKRIESYFHWRLTGLNKPEEMDPEEQELAQKFYHEALVRYIVGYSNFIEVEIFRTGFSKLLAYPEFLDPATLAASLSLFENAQSMRHLLKDCSKHNTLKVWIGDDLSPHTTTTTPCTVLTIPYTINNKPVGAIGLLGPTRLPYRELFGLLRNFADNISEALTRNLYKFKLNFRQPEEKMTYIHAGSKQFLLEDKRINNDE
jgi:heat-inducible transcriptional repressor